MTDDQLILDGGPLRLCTFEGCGRPHIAKGYCWGHYKQLRSGKPLAPLTGRRSSGRTCTFEECDRPVSTGDHCHAHNQQLRRGEHLRPLRVRQDPTAWLRAVAMNCDPGPCLPWPFHLTDQGYGRIHRKGQQVLAHRLSLELAGRLDPDPDLQVAHSCGNSVCVNPHHLRMATAAENNADKLIHGTAPSALTEDQVREIRASTDTLSVLSARYGITEGALSRIRNRKTWKRIDAEGP